MRDKPACPRGKKGFLQQKLIMLLILDLKPAQRLPTRLYQVGILFSMMPSWTTDGKEQESMPVHYGISRSVVLTTMRNIIKELEILRQVRLILRHALVGWIILPGDLVNGDFFLAFNTLTMNKL
jgi:hypothetical protein